MLPNSERAYIEPRKVRDYLLSEAHPSVASRLPSFRDCHPGLTMYSMLETVALVHDIPSAGLLRGDLGAIVDVHSSDAYEVEFVAASGRTQALLTLHAHDLRALGDDDLLAVRSIETSRG